MDGQEVQVEAVEQEIGEERADGWQEFVDAHLEAYFAAHPAFAVVQGRHDHDGRLPDWSEAGIAAEVDRLCEERRQALAFDDSALGPEQRFERDHLVAVVDRNLFWLAEVEWPFRNPVFYFDWLLDSLDPNVYVTRPYAPLAERLQAYTRWAENLVGAAGQIRANLRLPMPRTWLERGLAAFAGLADYFEGAVVLAFREVADPALRRRFEAANAAAAAAMRDLGGWLEGARAVATEAFALGEERFARMLWACERVGTPLAELEELGRHDLERNLVALEAACAALAPGLSVADCLARVRADKPAGGAVTGAREQLAGLRDFVVEQQLASIPGDERVLVEEAPPYNRSNFAYIDIPGVYDEGMPSVYYIAPPDPSWPEEVRADYLPGRAGLLFTSAHEIWPGHFLQHLHAERCRSKLGRLFVGYGSAEGWSHYSEELIWEAGYGGGDLRIRIGQLTNALLRNARFLAAIGLHTGGMTVEAAERLFRDWAWQDPGTARNQAARGTWDPAYIHYTLGKLMIRELREEWCVQRGGRRAWRQFHDRFLSFGGPPVALVRAAMRGG